MTFRPSAKTAVLTLGAEQLRVAWTSSGIAAVERESLRTRRALEKRLRMALVDDKLPKVIRDFLVLAAKGKGADAPLDLAWARDYERDVLLAAQQIPYGQTRSYSWLAREARRPLAVRAAASAMARNPLWLLIPCHRVIYSDGRLGPYGDGSRGLARKRALLAREGIVVKPPETKAEKRSRKRARTKPR